MFVHSVARGSVNQKQLPGPIALSTPIAPPCDDGPISLGQIAVQAEVQVRFSLK
ncbi:MAG TPA: hypothetical protein VFF59_12980 [Anaerolineae bacterium]|nr:hypothetical protein [Anaerolineae bacterium]